MFTSRVLSAVTLLFVLFVSLPVTAAEKGDIYVIDMQKVIQDSRAGMQARESVQKSVKSKEGRFRELQNEIQQLRENYAKQVTILSADAREEKTIELRRQEKTLRRKIQDEQEAMSRKHDKEVARIVKEIDKIIANIAKEEEIPLVIEKDKQFVIHVAEQYNLTNRVLKRLDAQWKG